MAIQKVGQGETGVLAVTAFAERVQPRDDEEDGRPLPVPLFDPRSGDSVTLIQSDEPESRWPEVTEFVERTLAAAVDEFGRQLS